MIKRLERLRQDEMFIEKSQEYWNRRVQEIRFFYCVIVASNIVYSLSAIFDPKSQRHLVVNLGYLFLSLLTVIFLVLTYKNKKYLPLLKELSVLIVVRNVIRCFDIEQTKDTMTNGEWHNLINIQQAILIHMMALFVKSFDLNSAYTNFIVFINYYMTFSCPRQGHFHGEDNDVYSVLIFSMLVTIVVLVYVNRNDI
jgi:hypothetical protein